MKILEKINNLLKMVDNLLDYVASFIIYFLSQLMSPPKMEDEVRLPKLLMIFIYLLSVIFGLAIWYDFKRDLINKSGLDTFIVIISLISLILNNLFSAFSSSRYEKYLSKIFVHLSYSLFIWFFLTLIANLLDCILGNKTYFWLSFVIFISAIVVKVLNKILIKKEKNLVYAAWWVFILIMYLIKLSSYK